MPSRDAGLHPPIPRQVSSETRLAGPRARERKRQARRRSCPTRAARASGGAAAALLLAGFGRLASTGSMELAPGMFAVALLASRAKQGAGPSALLSTQTREDARPPCCRAKAGLRADAAEAADGRRRRELRVWRIRGLLPQPDGSPPFVLARVWSCRRRVATCPRAVISTGLSAPAGMAPSAAERRSA